MRTSELSVVLPPQFFPDGRRRWGVQQDVGADSQSVREWRHAHPEQPAGWIRQQTQTWHWRWARVFTDDDPFSHRIGKTHSHIQVQFVASLCAMSMFREGTGESLPPCLTRWRQIINKCATAWNARLKHGRHSPNHHQEPDMTSWEYSTYPDRLHRFVGISVLKN